jgi:hypothetical protein
MPDNSAYAAGERVLPGRSVASVEELAELPMPLATPLDGVSRSAFERVREQARIQVRGRSEGRPVHELLQPITPLTGPWCADASLSICTPSCGTRSVRPYEPTAGPT